MFQKSIIPMVSETMIKAKTMPINIRFLLPNLGKTPLGNFILSVVIRHRR